MQTPHSRNRAKGTPAEWRWSDTFSTDLLVTIVLSTLAIWGIVEIIRFYPSQFFPRTPDEGIYALNVRMPQLLFEAYRADLVRYAPTKLGYGLPLAGAPLGWDCVSEGKSDPQFGDDDRIAGVSWKATASLIGVSVASGLILRTLERRGWI